MEYYSLSYLNRGSVLHLNNDLTIVWHPRVGG